MGIKKPPGWGGFYQCDPDWIRTNDLLLSLPATAFAAHTMGAVWGLDYIFTIAGVPRIVSTEPF